MSKSKSVVMQSFMWIPMEYPPEPGKRVLFGCENGFVCEGFMCYFNGELRPVRFDGDRTFFDNIVPPPKWWAEMPEVPEE